MEKAKGVVTPKACIMRGRGWSALFLATFVFGFLCARTASATTVSMQSLTNGESLLVGNLLFSDFSINGDFTASQVNVTTIQDSFGFGIQFSGAFVAQSTLNSTQSFDLILDYSVTVTNGAPPISDVHLLINGSAIGDGLAETIEQVSSGNNVFLDQLQAYSEATTNQLQDSLNLFPDESQLEISKDVLLAAVCDGFATISTIDQTFSEVPEPSAFVLCILGLVGVHLLRRRRKPGS